MSIGARPLHPRDVAAIIDRKMADFAAAVGDVQLRHLPLARYFDCARDDPDVRFALETGYLHDVEDEFRDPVLASIEERRVMACPDLVCRLLSDEPAEIHRAFVEGAFFRKLFRFVVPATHEGGPAWEAEQQVREIMQRHFAFQLVVAETILQKAS